MQRTEDGGVVISCDFCATDWDEVKPMIEGHRGSVLCLACLDQALRERQAHEGTFFCTMCIRENLPATLPRWRHSDQADKWICEDCILQAARAFDRDKDIDWQWQRDR